MISLQIENLSMIFKLSYFWLQKSVFCSVYANIWNYSKANLLAQLNM